MVLAMKRKTLACRRIVSPALAGKIVKGKPGKIVKRKPASAHDEQEPCDTNDVPKEETEQEREVEEKEVEQEVGQEELIAQREEETCKARRKELKGTAVETLKELIQSKGLEKGKKEDMVDALVAHEARSRAKEREQEARVRAVVAGKVAELNALSLPALKKEGATIGLKGQLGKQPLVEGLLKQWQEDDGVDKALAKLSRDARVAQLDSMDKHALQCLCAKVGVDPFVKEILVERLVKLEAAAGKFARPKLYEPEKEEQLTTGKTMVDALLASEATRKKEKELKMQREKAAASKHRELEEMTIEQLKKIAAKKKLETTGKKQDFVRALFEVSLREDAAAARKEHLKSMSAEDLRRLLQQNGVCQTGKVETMVDAFLAHEAKIQDELRAFELVVDEVLAKRKEELDAETGARLKDLCESKGVKVGVSKEERINNYLEAARQDGEADAGVAILKRERRSAALFAVDSPSLVSLCKAAGIDPLVKEVMVERLITQESEQGPVKGADEEDAAPAAKKARKSKK